MGENIVMVRCGACAEGGVGVGEPLVRSAFVAGRDTELIEQSVSGAVRARARVRACVRAHICSSSSYGNQQNGGAGAGGGAVDPMICDRTRKTQYSCPSVAKQPALRWQLWLHLLVHPLRPRTVPPTTQQHSTLSTH